MYEPWYRQFWPWFLIILPLCSIAGGIGTLLIATGQPVSLVAEDYYKQGKAINADLSKLKAAVDGNIRYRLQIEGQQGLLSHISGDLLTGLPLRITFFHRTLAGRDFSRQLSADASGRYRFHVAESLQGHWNVRVEPVTGEWRIQKAIAFPSNAGIILDGVP
jgi:hypothetical protein